MGEKRQKRRRIPEAQAAGEQLWEGEFGEFLFKEGVFLAPLSKYLLERMWEERLEVHEERMRMHMEDEDIHEMKREKEEVVAEEDAEGAEEDEVITIDTSAAEASEEEDAEETRLLSEEASRGAWDLAMMARLGIRTHGGARDSVAVARYREESRGPPRVAGGRAEHPVLRRVPLALAAFSHMPALPAQQVQQQIQLGRFSYA